MSRRLIDADALKEYIDCGHLRNPCEVCFSELDVVNLIDAQPTIDTEPVRHGKWIDETFEPWGLVHHPYKCNLCGEHAEFASPYCPNCGARMDEERKEE